MGTKTNHERGYRKLCQLLREWREEAGLTQREVGERLRKPHSFVHKSETGERRIDPVEFHRLCEAMDLDAVDCFKMLDKVLKP